MKHSQIISRKARERTVAKAVRILDAMNAKLCGLYTSLDCKIYPFGSQLTWLTGAHLASSVVVHRLTKAYEKPQEVNESERRDRSIASVLEQDLSCPHLPLPGTPEYGSLLKIRYLINTICGKTKPTYQLVFPTGEGFTSLHGEKDLYNKLESMQVWECSPSSFKYVSKIFYGNPHMKRYVKKRFYQQVAQEFGYDRRFISRKLYKRFGSDGFRTFRCMLSALVKLTDVSRMTTVPKDNLKDRVITCEPFLTMICQLSYMHDLRTSLKRATGLDLSVLQDWHKAFLRMGRATIDLKDASNRVWNNYVKFLFPPRVNKILQQLRTGQTELPDGTYHAFNMFSPMGCGLTFDVMTILLLATTRKHDFGGTVFGDDIMCDAKCAPHLLHDLRLLGLKVNEDKSFFVGNFRESCGAYADLVNNRFITCYDLRRPTNYLEVVVATNKLRMIIEANQCLPQVNTILECAWSQLLDIFPCFALSERRPESLGEYVWGNPRDPDTVYCVDWQRNVRNITQVTLKASVKKGRVDPLTSSTVQLLYMRRTKPLSAHIRERLRFVKV